MLQLVKSRLLEAQPTLELSVVVPTFNEAGNVDEVVARLEHVLDGIDWEVVFVDDDSTDGTWQRLTEISQYDRRVRLIRRIGRRGLASAVMEGALATTSPVVAVMDADLQHDETRLPAMFQAIASQGHDLAVGSRYCSGGSTGAWDQKRVGISRFATRVAAPLLKTPLSDPMSGFFAIRREALLDAAPHLSTVGYKILLDLVASSPRPLSVAEIPYEFRDRTCGESKLDAAVALEYGELLLDKLIGRYVPVKLVLFGAIGALGVLIHLAVLGGLLKGLSLPFAAAQATAVVTAMTFNYALNNRLTYRDRQRRGWQWLTGLFTFYLVCALGAVGNVGVGSLVYQSVQQWWLAGIAGAVVGSVWNYVASAWFTWSRR